MVAAAPPRKATPPPAPKVGTCRGVEIFAAGRYRGRTYTVPELDEIVRGFHKLGRRGLNLLQVPVVIGHEETQEFLERTDLPAAGWLANVRRRGDILVGDFAEVPLQVAALIKSRAYRKCSVEIYDDFPDDFGRTHGMALRRVALLGGEIPQVKRLADIPLAVFSEARATRRLSLRRVQSTRLKNGTWLTFSEVVPMNRDQLVAAALAAGLTQDVVDAMPDDMLAAVMALPALAANAAPVAAMADMPRADLIAELTAAGQDPVALEAMDDAALQALYDTLTTPPAPAAPMADAGTPPPTKTRDEMIAELVAKGHDPATLDPKTDEELAAMIAAPMSDKTAGAAKPAAPAPAKPKPAPAFNAVAFAEKTALAAAQKLTARLAAENAKLDADAKRRRKADAVAFCDRLVVEGRLTGVQEVKDAIVLALVAADDAAVQKFSEGGKTVEATAFERLKAKYAAMPKVVHFGEKLKGGPASPEAEVATVTAFAEKVLPAAAQKAYVEKFSELRKKAPALTAAQFGVPADFVAAYGN